MNLRYLTLNPELTLHRRTIERRGGTDGIRDPGLLESPINVPRTTFERQPLHPGPARIAAAYRYHLCQNDPCNDGNKPVAVLAAGVVLNANRYGCIFESDELEALTLAVPSDGVGKRGLTLHFD